MTYIDDVAAQLTLRGAVREQALADLRDLLLELSPETLGPPAEYAAALNEEFGTSAGLPERLLGVPLSLVSGLGDRLAGIFNPADERLMVPRLFGLGWAVNMGYIAVKLGLLRPDDVDDEVLNDAVELLDAPQVAAGAAIAGAAATTAVMAHRRHEIKARTGESATSSIVFGTLLPVVSAALLVASTDSTQQSAQRLTMPATAGSLALLSMSACWQKSWRPRGNALVLSGVAAAAVTQLTLSYLPVRTALRARWAHERSTRNA